MEQALNEPVEIKEYIKAPGEKPELLKKMQAKAEGRRYHTENKYVYVDDRVLELLKLAPEKYQWAVLHAYRPPVAGLTDEDFLQEVQKRLSALSSSSGNWYRSSFSIDPRWQADLIAKRSPSLERNYLLTSLIADELEYRKKVSSNFAKEVNLLNEFLASDFPGTFEDYLASDLPDEVQDRVANYYYKDYPHRTKVISFAGHRTVAHFGRSTQKRTRKLLLAQDRATWNLIVERASEYSKGKTHQHAEKFLQELKGEATENIYSVDEIKELVATMAARLYVEEESRRRANVQVLKETLDAFDSYYTLKNYGREYYELLQLLKSYEPTLEELLSVVIAVQVPGVWLRSGKDNAFMLLLDVLKSDQDAQFLKLLRELVLNNDAQVPTETEWRLAIETALYNTAPSWFLAITVKSTARHITPQQVRELRARLK